MKKYLLFVIIFGFGTQICFSQEYYFFQDEKTYLEIVPNEFIIRISDSNVRDTDNIVETIQQINDIENAQLAIKHSKGIDIIIKSKTFLEKEELKKILNNHNINPLICNHLFLSEDNVKVTYLDEILLKPKSGVDVTTILRPFNLSIHRTIGKNQPTYLIKTIDNNLDMNTLDIANHLYKTQYFRYVEPNLLCFNTKTCIEDPKFPDQWSMENNNSSHIDIDICEAWDYTKGNQSIKVAVLDDGIDNHIDLVDVLSSGYDAWALELGFSDTLQKLFMM